jgi:hypothetical protein
MQHAASSWQRAVGSNCGLRIANFGIKEFEIKDSRNDLPFTAET